MSDDQVFSKLAGLTAQPEPDSRFVHHLREELMSGASISAVRPEQPAPYRWPRLRAQSSRSKPIAGAFATLALVAVSLVGIFLFNHQPDPTNRQEFNSAQRPNGGTPQTAGSPRACPSSQVSYGQSFHIAIGTFTGVISNEAADSTHWQMLEDCARRDDGVQPDRAIRCRRFRARRLLFSGFRVRRDYFAPHGVRKQCVGSWAG